MSRKPFNDEMSQRGFNSTFDTKNYLKSDPDRWYVFGKLLTPHGYASLYIQNSGTVANDAHSKADFIWKGRWYRRTWRRQMSERGLAIAAGKMVREIVAGKFKRS